MSCWEGDASVAPPAIAPEEGTPELGAAPVADCRDPPVFPPDHFHCLSRRLRALVDDWWH